MNFVYKSVVRFLLIATFFVMGGLIEAKAIVSPYQSMVSVQNPTAPADGISRIKVEGVVKDAFGSVVQGAKIRVKNITDAVQIDFDSHSNQQGYFSGTLVSAQTGVLNVAVEADGTELFDVPQVVFSLPKKQPLKPVGASASSGGFASFLKAQLFDESTEEVSAVSYFDINAVTNKGKVSEKLSVTVTAKDVKGVVDPTYNGTIRFSVPTDPNASLPTDYTFTAEDQGVHVFHLALSFDQPGEHELSVQDLDDVRIAGTMILDIEDEEGQTEEQPDLNQNIEITVPKNGAILSAPRVNILGSAAPGTVVSINDGSTEIGTNIATSPTGEFAFQTPALAHGEHVFTATYVDDPTKKSSPITIQIDREGPTVMKVLVDPNPVLTQSEVKVTVGSDEEISSATFVINNESVVLSRTDSKTFVGTFIAPEIGDYPYSASIFDALGNEKNESNAGVLKVVDQQASLEARLDRNNVSEGDQILVKTVSQVPLSGVDVVVNGLPIPMIRQTPLEFVGTLVAPEKGEYPISVTGKSETDGTDVLPSSPLVLTVVDKSIKMTDFPTSVVPGKPVSFDGESDKPITSIRAVIENDVVSNVDVFVDETVEEVLRNKKFKGSFVSPSTIGMNTLTVVANFEDGTSEELSYDFMVEEPSGNAAPTSIQNLQAKPGNNRVTLFWTPAKDDVAVKQYKIKYNEAGKPLTSMNITPDDRTQWYVDGLKNHVKYQFTVTPIDIDELEGVESLPVEATPAGTKNTIPKAPTSGANTAWMNGLIVFVLGLLFLFWKRKKIDI